MRRPDSLAAPNAGRSRAARIAIIAITTSNSIKVKARGGATGRRCAFKRGGWGASGRFVLIRKRNNRVILAFFFFAAMLKTGKVQALTFLETDLAPHLFKLVIVPLGNEGPSSAN